MSVVSTMRAAKHLTVALNSVADDATIAVTAMRGKCMDGALERIERVPGAVERYREGLVVVITANLADCHGASPF